MNNRATMDAHDSMQELKEHQPISENYQEQEFTPNVDAGLSHLFQSISFSAPSVKNSNSSPLGFFDLPLEMRLMIYKNLLLVPSIIFEAFRPPLIDESSPHISPIKRYGISLAILQVNKQINDEASSILYSQNCFDFSAAFPTPYWPSNDVVLKWFLAQIGDRNASFLQNISIQFPYFDWRTGANPLEFRESMEESIAIFKQIKDKCTQVTTIKMVMHDFHELCFRSRVLNDAQHASQALGVLEEALNAITSLKLIMVEVIKYENNGTFRMSLTNMGERGWKIQIS